MSDATNPDHYRSHPSGVECITVTEHFGFCIGNAIKYLWRADLKHDDGGLEDLRKAAWYIDREIKRREALKSLTGTRTPEPPAGPSEGAPRAAQPGLRVGARARISEKAPYRAGSVGIINGSAGEDPLYDWIVKFDHRTVAYYKASELEVIG